MLFRSKIKNWKPYDEDKGYYIIEEFRKVENRIIHYAASITSHARVKLYEYLYNNSKSIIYCDTDSIHLNNIKLKKTEISNNKLGYMKYEGGGLGIYIGRKQYTHSSIMKFKGVKTEDKLLNNHFTVDMYRDLMYNKTINYNYGSFPKLKTVIMGREPPCKIIEIKKKLVKSSYLSNFQKGE